MHTKFSMWFCCVHTYLVRPNRGPRILLLQVTTRNMRLRGLYPTKRQKAGLCTNLNGDGIIPWRIAGWGKKIWPMLLNSYKFIKLGVVFDLFDLLLTSGKYGLLQAHPILFRPLCLRECFLPGVCIQLDWNPWVSDFFCCLQFSLSHSH